MKKYKLIKEYPRSPILGSYTDNTYESGNACKVIRPDGTTFSNSFGWYWVTNFPEFWEEFVEIDYEILSMKCKKSKLLHFNNSESSLNFMLENDYSIHSIKRKSDGEIFTIGDNVISKTCAVPNKILSIELRNNKIRLYPRNSYYNLEDIHKAKQKLFISEDDVEIFEGDIVWHINLNNNKEPYPSIFKYTKPFTPFKGLFSTKEAAQEYVLMNKPCLSFRDIMSEVSLTDTGKKTLKSLIEKKLNK